MGICATIVILCRDSMRKFIYNNGRTPRTYSQIVGPKIVVFHGYVQLPQGSTGFVLIMRVCIGLDCMVRDWNGMCVYVEISYIC